MKITDMDVYKKGKRSALYLGYALSDQEVLTVVGNNSLAIEVFRRGENSILQQSVMS